MSSPVSASEVNLRDPPERQLQQQQPEKEQDQDSGRKPSAGEAQELHRSSPHRAPQRRGRAPRLPETPGAPAGAGINTEDHRAEGEHPTRHIR